MLNARESIILSAVRTFCVSFAGIIGLFIGAALVFICIALFSAPDIFPPKPQVQVAPDAEGNRKLLSPNTPVFLKLNIHGVIGQLDLTSEKFQSLLLDSRTDLFNHNRVKGIILSIKSPGGAADDSANIHQAILQYKQKYNVPVYAFVDGLCASGGMYIASSADRIYATTSSVIGSVGVILGPTFNVSSLMQRYGVQSLTLAEGKDKDMLNPFRPWEPGEDASLRAITSALYSQFVDAVVAGRPHLDRDALVNTYGAQVYVADQAQEYGYIDVAGADYSRVVADLAEACQLGEQPYQVMTLSPSHSLFADLFQNKFSLLKGEVKHSLQLSAYMNSELSGRFLYLYQPGIDPL